MGKRVFGKEYVTAAWVPKWLEPNQGKVREGKGRGKGRGRGKVKGKGKGERER